MRNSLVRCSAESPSERRMDELVVTGSPLFVRRPATNYRGPRNVWG